MNKTTLSPKALPTAPDTVLQVIEAYPKPAQEALHRLREFVWAVAADEGITDLQEALRWGEPSFLCKTGTTLRIDWKPKHPERVSILVNCQSQLIATVKELYPTTLKTIGKREISLPLGQPWPVSALKHAISLTLTYHSVKHLPLLGA